MITAQPGEGFRHPDTPSSLEALFVAALRAAGKREPLPKVHASFYPYAGLSSTIRLRNGLIYARVSDVMEDSPPAVLFALAMILVAKLYRRKPGAEYEKAYRDYAASAEVMAAAEAVRKTRGYKLTSSPKGKFYDLEQVFDCLNRKYFEGRLSRPVLSWSLAKTRRILGHHDHVHDTIIVSKTLDSADIPRLVLDYVLYHEMLHIKHPPRLSGTRTIYHGREFKEDEQKFEDLQKALKWLDRIALPPRKRRRPTRSRPTRKVSPGR